LRDFFESRLAEYPENRDAEQKSSLAEQASQPAPMKYEPSYRGNHYRQTSPNQTGFVLELSRAVKENRAGHHHQDG
jgi:hypothetical protein